MKAKIFHIFLCAMLIPQIVRANPKEIPPKPEFSRKKIQESSAPKTPAFAEKKSEIAVSHYDKTGNFLKKEASFGGHFLQSPDLRLKSIRHSLNKADFERLVFEFENSSLGFQLPYFNFSKSEEQNQKYLKLKLALYATANLDKSLKSILEKLKSKLRFVKNISFVHQNIHPLEPYSLIFETDHDIQYEIFELSNPSRIVLDLKPLP